MRCLWNISTRSSARYFHSGSTFGGGLMSIEILFQTSAIDEAGTGRGFSQEPTLGQLTPPMLNITPSGLCIKHTVSPVMWLTLVVLRAACWMLETGKDNRSFLLGDLYRPPMRSCSGRHKAQSTTPSVTPNKVPTLPPFRCPRSTVLCFYEKKGLS